MNDLEIKIIKLIITAQQASDSAKGIVSTLPGSAFHSKHTPVYYCYNKKDSCILDAIYLIDHNKLSSIRYYISRDDSINSALVYFEIRLKETKFQISFYSFNRSLMQRIGSGMPMRWKGIAGSSRHNALALVDLLGDNM